VKQTETCAIDQVTAGAVLAADVVDAGGRILMPAGATLTAAALDSLQRRDITSLSIESIQQEDPAAREARRVRLETRLARLFRHAGEQTEMRALQHAVLNYRLKENA